MRETQAQLNRLEVSIKGEIKKTQERLEDEYLASAQDGIDAARATGRAEGRCL